MNAANGWILFEYAGLHAYWKNPLVCDCFNLDSEGNRSDGKRCYLHHTHRYEDKSYFWE